MKNKIYLSIIFLLLGVVLSQFFGLLQPEAIVADDLFFDEQEATVRAIKSVQPAVVSIRVYGYSDFYSLSSPTGQPEVLKKRKVVQKGTGFLISADGYIITNRHVVENGEKDGEFQVILNSGQEYYAQFISKDRFNDLAVLKIFDKDLPYVKLGDSDQLEAGMSVIAIGNALGQYENSVTKGIVSALGRSLTASSPSGATEDLTNTIQTDAKINVGNSGGPLINLRGEVVGINTAVEQAGSAIGFAIPINDAKPVIESIIEKGVIARPYLGVRYLMLSPEISADYKIGRDTGAWLFSNNDNEPAIVPDSPADKAGLAAGDVIFEVNAVKIEEENTLSAILKNYKPGDKIGLKVLRGEKTLIVVVELAWF